MITVIIFIACIFFFILDRYPLAVIAMAGCCAMVLFKAATTETAFSGFANDIVFILFGTEIFGIAYQESGLSYSTARIIKKYSSHEDERKATFRIIFIAGSIAAIMSAFINTQVVCLLMIIICISTAREMKNLKLKNITLPIIYMAILGGQCTLIGAPATLVASSISDAAVGYRISMFRLLPMGLILLLIGGIYLRLFSFRHGNKIWGDSEKEQLTAFSPSKEIRTPDRKKSLITGISGIAMLVLFVTEFVSVGTASMIGAAICLFGRVVDFKEACAKVDWNIIVWLGASIGLAAALNDNPAVKKFSESVSELATGNISPILILTIFVLVTTVISNFIANTTTVMMVLPFALQITEQLGCNPEPFVIAITMAAGLSIMTPLSCGYIGMTMRIGYRFKDYVRYGMNLQLVLTTSIILLTCLMYSF